MGILKKLTDDGSFFSYNNGDKIPTNILTTKQSPLHYNNDNQQPGYSVTGEQFPQVNTAMETYVDGSPNPLPLPSQLDLDDPITADIKYKPLYTSINGGYLAVASQLKQP
jgi:hypothetical protein